MRQFRLIATFAALAATLPLPAEEGMWTFDNPPLKELKTKYNFTPTQAWLDHVRLSSVRLNDGGSGSFISPHGLLLTNHHVARGQLQKNSTAQHDYIANGFYAATLEDEMKSPDLEVNVLVGMENVTARIAAAIQTAGAKTPEQQFAARRAAIAAIEKESQDKTGLRSDVVDLYHGGEYWLYQYKRYTDVRIVFAPEQQTAFFGGDPDNFTYPRYDLDMALFRVYENGKPIDSKDYLKWNPKGAADGDLVFVSGNPGSTDRLATISQLTCLRDIREPAILNIYRARIETLERFSSQGAEQQRQAASLIFGLQNGLKAVSGELRGLQDPAVMAIKQKDEDALRARVTDHAPWDAIAAAEKKAATRTKEIYYHGLDSALNNIATDIVQYVSEIKKPDGVRLPGYHDAQLESLRQRLFSPAPIYPGMEIARITGALNLDIAQNGMDDAFVKTVLNGKTPAEAAEALVNGTKLTDPAFRKQLIDGGQAAVDASTDAFIVLARKLDPMRRELIQWQQDNIESVEQQAGERIGKDRFAAFGKSMYPDATFTPRLSYGQVKGYPMNGTQAPPNTTMYGLYDRAASFSFKPPYNLPTRWSEGRTKLDLATPLDFVTTNDVVGGNSGSPVIDRNGEIVGLVFDGNIESLVGSFVYDIRTNRTVSVHTAAMTEALRKLYGADAILNEMLTGQLRN